MREVLELLADVEKRSDKLRTIYVLVKFDGDEDYSSAYCTSNGDDLAFELRSETMRMRGG